MEPIVRQQYNTRTKDSGAESKHILEKLEMLNVNNSQTEDLLEMMTKVKWKHGERRTDIFSRSPSPDLTWHARPPPIGVQFPSASSPDYPWFSQQIEQGEIRCFLCCLVMPLISERDFSSCQERTSSVIRRFSKHTHEQTIRNETKTQSHEKTLKNQV